MNVAMNSFRTGVSTFTSRTNPSTAQSLQKSFHLTQPVKIELKKSPPFLKIKNTQPHNQTTDKIELLIRSLKPLPRYRFNYTVERKPACNNV
jgi:hypothetical protein